MSMTRKEFATKLVEAYRKDDAQFAEKANWTIEQYFTNLPKSKSKADPNRLNSKAVFVSNLRYFLMERVGPSVAEGHAAFNKMTERQQLKFQAKSRDAGTDKWVHKLEIMPQNISGLVMPPTESSKLKHILESSSNAKLKDDVREIDGDRLLTKMCPSLINPSPRWNALAAALLLVTGRRSCEILKSAEFYLDEEMDKHGYQCWFRGQSKTGLTGDVPFKIPLLAPFSIVHKALEYLREHLNTTGMTMKEVNLGYARGLNDYTSRSANMTPHELRAAYALSTYQLLPGKKMSLIGHIASVLGHVSSAAPTYYQRQSIVNLSGPWTPKKPVAEEQKTLADGSEEDTDGWIVKGAAEKKRLADIKEMQIHRKKITATSLRDFSGASMPPIQRLMLNNADKIAAYNKSLGEEGEKFAKVEK